MAAVLVFLLGGQRRADELLDEARGAESSFAKAMARDVAKIPAPEDLHCQAVEVAAAMATIGRPVRTSDSARLL